MSEVIWSESAMDQLAEFYVSLNPIERNRLFQIVASLNEILAENSQFIGESREGNRRIHFVPPLAVTYSVIPFGPIRVDKIRILNFWD